MARRLARRFAVVSLDTPRSASAPRFHRYEVDEDRLREETHGGRVVDLLARAGGDLQAAIIALLADWLPDGGPAGFPTPPAPRGIPARLPEAA